MALSKDPTHHCKRTVIPFLSSRSCGKRQPFFLISYLFIYVIFHSLFDGLECHIPDKGYTLCVVHLSLSRFYHSG